MKAWILAGAAFAALGIAGTALAQDVITARRDGLKGMGAHLEAIKAVSDARGDPRPVVGRIDEMIVFFNGLPARFPEGSGTGNTRALPTIWSDREGFERAAANMVAQLQALRAVAASGDAAALPAAFQQTGATCGACHRPYRGPAR
jgi:cytochrome c556